MLQTVALVLTENTWSHITVCQQIIIIDKLKIVQLKINYNGTYKIWRVMTVIKLLHGPVS